MVNIEMHRNISVGRSEDDDVGALENIIGNNLITSTYIRRPSDVQIIGVKSNLVYANQIYLYF